MRQESGINKYALVAQSDSGSSVGNVRRFPAFSSLPSHLTATTADPRPTIYSNHHSLLTTQQAILPCSACTAKIDLGIEAKLLAARASRQDWGHQADWSSSTRCKTSQSAPHNPPARSAHSCVRKHPTPSGIADLRRRGAGARIIMTSFGS